MATISRNSQRVAIEEEALKLIITEQKRDHDYLLHIYNRLRATEGLLLTATFGILAYLYYNSPIATKTSISERLFMPDEDYGKVIYLMAAGFFIYGLFKLMFNVFGYNPWMTAYEAPKTDYTYNKPLEILKYIRKRYDECLEFNSKKYSKRRTDLNFLFYCTLISAIILIVIKTLN